MNQLVSLPGRYVFRFDKEDLGQNDGRNSYFVRPCPELVDIRTSKEFTGLRYRYDLVISSYKIC